jgi:ribonuclease J
MHKQKPNYAQLLKRPTGSVQIIPLGGLDGIGKNMQIIRYKDEIIIVDAGMMFPDETMLGIDKVIPDMSYLRQHREKVKAVILTHAHEDHIGALPFLFEELTVPIYATKLTMGLALNKLKRKHKEKLKQVIVTARQKVTIGAFTVEFIQVNHSIPDGVGLAIRTPAGIIVHSGDFKVDHTPIDGKVIDLNRFAEIGDEGVLVFLSDSTNSDDAGYTLSERTVGETFEGIFKQATGRVIIATFASNIHRIQQAIDVAIKCRRQFVLLGRSVEENANIATKLGYLKYPLSSRATKGEMKNIRPEKLAVISTGSQGEPMSALTKMARNEFRYLKITPSDTIVISATPIPGNEKQVTRCVDSLFKLGANVIYEAESDVHVSGHANREEQKLLLSLVKPKYFIPIHGEYRHLKYHAQIAHDLGLPKNNIFVAENGNILEFSSQKAGVVGQTNGGGILIDGLGQGRYNSKVLQDRQVLSKEGIFSISIVVSSKKKRVLCDPFISSIGFLYLDESSLLLKQIAKKVRREVNKLLDVVRIDIKKLEEKLKKYLCNLLYEQTHGRPTIIAVIMDVNAKQGRGIKA